MGAEGRIGLRRHAEQWRPDGAYWGTPVPGADFISVCVIFRLRSRRAMEGS